MTEGLVEWIRDPERRVRGAWGLLAFCCVGWPSTHALMYLTHPPENTWVFHVLLAISWLALVLTALNILATTDVRAELDEGE